MGAADELMELSRAPQCLDSLLMVVWSGSLAWTAAGLQTREFRADELLEFYKVSSHALPTLMGRPLWGSGPDPMGQEAGPLCMVRPEAHVAWRPVLAGSKLPEGPSTQSFSSAVRSSRMRSWRPIPDPCVGPFGLYFSGSGSKGPCNIDLKMPVNTPEVVVGVRTQPALEPMLPFPQSFELVLTPLHLPSFFSALSLSRAQSDNKLKKFLHILEGSPVVPVICDAKRTVLSLPPIINSAHSAITLDTRNVFVECTAVDLTKANTVLNTVVRPQRRSSRACPLHEEGHPGLVPANSAREGSSFLRLSRTLSPRFWQPSPWTL